MTCLDKIMLEAKLYSIHFTKSNSFWRSCVFTENDKTKDVRTYICNSLKICDENLKIIEKFDCTIFKHSFTNRFEKGFIESSWIDGVEYAVEIVENNRKEYKIFIADFDIATEEVFAEIHNMYPKIPLKIDCLGDVWLKRSDIF